MRGLAGIANVDPRGVEQLSIPDVAECGTLARAPKQHRGNIPDLVPARLDIVRNRLPFPDHVFLCDHAHSTCWIADKCQPRSGSRSSRRKVQTSVASRGAVRSPEMTRPVARSTMASTREYRIATVA